MKLTNPSAVTCLKDLREKATNLHVVELAQWLDEHFETIIANIRYCEINSIQNALEKERDLQAIPRRKTRQARKKENRENCLSLLKDLYIEIDWLRRKLNFRHSRSDLWQLMMVADSLDEAIEELYEIMRTIAEDSLQEAYNKLCPPEPICFCFDPVDEDDAKQQFGRKPITSPYDSRLEHNPDCPWRAWFESR